MKFGKKAQKALALSILSMSSIAPCATSFASTAYVGTQGRTTSISNYDYDSEDDFLRTHIYYDEAADETVLLTPKSSSSDETAANAYMALTGFIMDTNLRVDEVNQVRKLRDGTVEIRINGIKKLDEETKDELAKVVLRGSDNLSQRYPEWFPAGKNFFQGPIKVVAEVASGKDAYCNAAYCHVSTSVGEDPTASTSAGEVVAKDPTEAEKLIKEAALKALDVCQSQGKCKGISRETVANASVADITAAYNGSLNVDKDLVKHMHEIWDYAYNPETGMADKDKIERYHEVAALDEDAVRLVAEKAYQACKISGRCTGNELGNGDLLDKDLYSVGKIVRFAQGGSPLGREMLALWEASDEGKDKDKIEDYLNLTPPKEVNRDADLSDAEMGILEKIFEWKGGLWENLQTLISQNKLLAAMAALSSAVVGYGFAKGYGMGDVLSFRSKAEIALRKFFFYR